MKRLGGRTYILILDVGTTNLHATVLAADGTVLGRAKTAYPEAYPQPGWVEQNPEDWWAAAGWSAREALAAAGAESGQIAAIGATGQMHGVVAVDAQGVALAPCLTLRDQRAVAEAQEITDRLGLEEIYRITGARLAPSLPAAKIRWISRHWPGVHRRARAFLPPKDYLRLRLTGCLATEALDAAGMLLLDIHTGQWSETMAEVAGVPADKLPPIHAPWDPAGPVTGEAARHLGLLAGTPVFVGAGDDIEYLGHGLLERGTALEHIGSTGSIMACVNRSVVDLTLVVDLYPHISPDLWLVGGSVNAAGSAIDWARRALSACQPPAPAGSRLQGGKGADSLGAVLATYEGHLPSLERPLVFLPYLAGERCPIWDPAARGAWFGLTMAHGPADLWRAVLEGVVFSLRHVLETVEGLGVSIPALVAQRGEDSAQWLTMRANIYGKPLCVVDSLDATALGTLIVTGKGVGWYADPAAGVAATRGREELIAPDPEAASRYDRLYGLYKEFSSACRPLFSRFQGA